jgi:hypothetical protein
MEMVLRAIAIYLVLMVVFKIAGRRALLQMTSFDLILLLIISEATQQALLGNDFSVTGAALTIITLVTVDILFGYIKKYINNAEDLIDGAPVILVEHGQMLRGKMKRLISPMMTSWSPHAIIRALISLMILNTPFLNAMAISRLLRSRHTTCFTLWLSAIMPQSVSQCAAFSPSNIALKVILI